ncbi:MAG: MFS transporter [Clostridia bacterium]|nr:MFS transporter [Clostridia bacterium]
MKRNRGWLCFVLCYLGYMGVYISRNNLSIISPQLKEAGFATEAQLGLLTGLFSLGYAAGKLICGPLGDRFNPKNVAALGVAISGVSNILIGISVWFFPSFPFMLIMWIANSFGQSLVWGPLLRLVSLNFSKERAPFITSMLVTTTATGGIAGILLASGVSHTDTALGFLVPGAVSLAAAAALLLFFPGKTRGENSAPSRGGIISAFRLKEVQKMLLPAFMQGIIKDNVLNWASLYLAAQFLMDLKSLPFFVLLIPLISFIGRLCYPIFYKICRNDQALVTKLCFAGCIVFCIPLILGVKNEILAILLLVLLSTLGNVMNTSFLSIFPMSMEHTGKVSTIASVMDVVTYSGLGISSAVFGWLINSFGLTGYKMMFGVFGLAALLGLLLLQFTKNTYKKLLD